MEQLLELKVGPEAYELELADLDTYHFRDLQVQQIYSEVVKTNSLIKKQIIQKYANDELDYYATQWIVTNYRYFIYHTNRFFEYLKVKETTPWVTETDDAILTHYRKMRTHYNRVKYLVSR